MLRLKSSKKAPALCRARYFVCFLVLSFYFLWPNAPAKGGSEEENGSTGSQFDEIVRGMYAPQPNSRFLNPSKLPPLEPGENLEHVTYRTGLRESLDKILAALGLSKNETQSWLASIRKNHPATPLPQGKELHFYFTKTQPSQFGESAAKQLKALEIPVDADRILTWEKGTQGIAFKRRENSYDVEVVTVGVNLETSFVQDGLRAGLNPTLLSQLVDIFSWEVDFENDLRNGDSL